MGIAFMHGGSSLRLRFMRFVDGTNFLSHMAEELKIELKPYKPSLESIRFATSWTKAMPISNTVVGYIVRNYWFSSYEGDDVFHDNLAKELRNCEFEPVLFKKRGNREKGVDIGLAKEMLVNAFNQNFDLGVLFAGDEDYVGLVNEVKRYGQMINGAFFSHGLSPKLQTAFDEFRLIKKERSTLFEDQVYKDLIEKHSKPG